MATTTFATAVADGTWTEIFDGSGAAYVGVQNGGHPDDPNGLLEIYIGTAAPDGNTTGFFVLSLGEDVGVNCADGDLVYGRGNGKAVARGYVEAS
jgi:hypothetical protein